MDHVDTKRFGIKILLHRKDYHCSDSTLLKHLDGFTFERFNRWRWYFRYLEARFQIENPRRLVELQIFNYTHLNEKEVHRINLKNKLRSAKAKVTEWTNKIERFRQGYNELFPIEEYPPYQRAIAKVEAKKVRVEELTKELASL